ncbi:MAG TPA: PfkB family carbohydrate kinase, partial [Gammaproteobacteria bacterium]|nr:PfkB family carbohydrate kinase [Gammaproteobacteria bacterium]
PCVPSSVVDLAGAGDAFAGGFLYGYTQGWSFKQSGELAMQMAAKVINVPGPRVILPEAAMI